MDAVGIVERIVKLALATKDAADTVRQNKELCREIKARAARVSALLSLLPAESTAALMDEPAMRGALEDLEESLRRALELVAACQEERSAAACLLLLCTAGKQSRRLRRAQDDISHNVMTVIFATNVQVTVILTRNPPPPPPRPLNDEATTASLADVDEEGGDSYTSKNEYRLHVEISKEDGKSSNIEQPSHPTPGSGISVIEESSPGYFVGPSFLFQKPIDGRYMASSSAQTFHRMYAFRTAPHGTAPQSSGLTKFNLSELDAATCHFSDDNLIGRGTFADVYKGELPKRLLVAIKKFHQPFQISFTLIHGGIHLFSKLQHPNVVKFIGYALEERSYFLVEEYMSGGSLNSIIASPLAWSSLFQIILGTANGLHYLHNQSFIHLDLKPSNILLGSDTNPKITNIGTATVLGQGNDDTIRDVSTVTGTLGYMAPEYITGGTLSTKCDVYGFGVILLEIISSMCKSQPTRGYASIEWAWMARSTKVSLDPSLYEGSQLKEINRCIEIGLLCTQFKPEDRPTMLDVLEMINGRKKLPMAKKPQYIKGSS